MKGRDGSFAVVLLILALSAGCGGGGGSGSSGSAGDSPDPTGPGTDPVGTDDGTGVFGGFSGDLDFVVEDPSSGVGDGADGAGGIAVGSNIGQIRNAEVVVFRLDDGSELGRASSGESGLVTVRPGRDYTGGLAVEIRGTAESDYYDYVRGTYLPYPIDTVLAAIVPEVEGNIGVSLYTNAAVAALARESGGAESSPRRRGVDAVSLPGMLDDVIDAYRIASAESAVTERELSRSLSVPFGPLGLDPIGNDGMPNAGLARPLVAPPEFEVIDLESVPHYVVHIAPAQVDNLISPGDDAPMLATLERFERSSSLYLSRTDSDGERVPPLLGPFGIDPVPGRIATFNFVQELLGDGVELSAPLAKSGTYLSNDTLYEFQLLYDGRGVAKPISADLSTGEPIEAGTYWNVFPVNNGRNLLAWSLDLDSFKFGNDDNGQTGGPAIAETFGDVHALGGVDTAYSVVDAESAGNEIYLVTGDGGFDAFGLADPEGVLTAQLGITVGERVSFAARRTVPDPGRTDTDDDSFVIDIEPLPGSSEMAISYDNPQRLSVASAADSRDVPLPSDWGGAPIRIESSPADSAFVIFEMGTPNAAYVGDSRTADGCAGADRPSDDVRPLFSENETLLEPIITQAHPTGNDSYFVSVRYEVDRFIYSLSGCGLVADTERPLFEIMRTSRFVHVITSPLNRGSDLAAVIRVSDASDGPPDEFLPLLDTTLFDADGTDITGATLTITAVDDDPVPEFPGALFIESLESDETNGDVRTIVIISPEGVELSVGLSTSGEVIPIDLVLTATNGNTYRALANSIFLVPTTLGDVALPSGASFADADFSAIDLDDVLFVDGAGREVLVTGTGVPVAGIAD